MAFGQTRSSSSSTRDAFAEQAVPAVANRFRSESGQAPATTTTSSTLVPVDTRASRAMANRSDRIGALHGPRPPSSRASNGRQSPPATAIEDWFPRHVEASSDTMSPASAVAAPDAPTSSEPPPVPAKGNLKRKRAKQKQAEEVEGKRCWICYDDDDPADPAGKRHGAWVHPCHCSLVAHEDVRSPCLLTRPEPDSCPHSAC